MDIQALTSPFFSYLVGLLQTDGSHEGDLTHKGRLQIELAECDRGLLDEIATALPWNASVTTRARATNFSQGEYRTATLRFYAQEARSFFHEAGVPIGRKSTIAAPPRHDFSAPDYVRGLLDGDGSLGFTGKGYPFVSFTTASPALADYLCSIIRAVCDVERAARPNTRDGVRNIMVTSVAAKKLATWAYHDGSLALERKRRKAAAIAAWTPPSTRYGVKKRAWTPEQDAVVLANPPAVAAALLNRSGKSIDARRWRLKNAGAGAAP
ncbi:hypothetical protein [Myceligenerans crystallogenes]|uniref:Homing endonuclease LAGLIDADG domain-containing protein n=1 Tax=Myceligenerans crystallogenes TaxID=316335 RepID=A0ABP4ZQ11_9MICO